MSAPRVEPGTATGAAPEPAAHAPHPPVPDSPVPDSPVPAAPARTGSAGGPALPEQSPEDTDAGWGEYPERDDDRLNRDRPPHWDSYLPNAAGKPSRQLG
jgi:hypothetical protein